MVRCFLSMLIPVFFLGSAAADESRKVTSGELRNDQLAVSGRYDRFERLLSQMADVLGREDPQRAELLRRAISKSREKAINRQLGDIAEELGDNNLGDALEQQENVLESLALLLQLLQSEDRRSELEKERERLNRLLRDVSGTLSQQRSARARTKNATAPSSAAPQQQKALERAEEILDGIRAHDGTQEDSDDSDGDPSEDGSDATGDDPDGDTKPKATDESESGGDESSRNGDASSKDAESSGAPKPSDPSESTEKGSEGSSSESRSGEQSSGGQQSTPGAQQIEQARERMQEALKRLQEQLREEAIQEQDEAIAALQEAVDELRELLRQLREEEKEMILASLEARLQRMLAQQTQIFDETVDLAQRPVSEWLDTMFARSREVAQQQTELQTECDQTLGLLREDGTSVAIVLSVEDIATDMVNVAGRLRESKVGALTQTLETDIIEALRELIAATQREMQEMKSGEQQQSAQSGQQSSPPLVQLLAEIKVLRSLQLRLNRRTKRVDGLLAEGSAEERQAVLDQLRELTIRQQRLMKSAEELAERISR